MGRWHKQFHQQPPPNATNETGWTAQPIAAAPPTAVSSAFDTPAPASSSTARPSARDSSSPNASPAQRQPQPSPWPFAPQFAQSQLQRVGPQSQQHQQQQPRQQQQQQQLLLQALWQPALATLANLSATTALTAPSAPHANPSTLKEDPSSESGNTRDSSVSDSSNCTAPRETEKLSQTQSFLRGGGEEPIMPKGKASSSRSRSHQRHGQRMPSSAKTDAPNRKQRHRGQRQEHGDVPPPRSSSAKVTTGTGARTTEAPASSANGQQQTEAPQTLPFSGMPFADTLQHTPLQQQAMLMQQQHFQQRRHQAQTLDNVHASMDPGMQFGPAYQRAVYPYLQQAAMLHQQQVQQMHNLQAQQQGQQPSGQQPPHAVDSGEQRKQQRQRHQQLEAEHQQHQQQQRKERLHSDQQQQQQQQQQQDSASSHEQSNKRPKLEQDALLSGDQSQQGPSSLSARDKNEIIAMASASAALNASSYASNVCQRIINEMSSRMNTPPARDTAQLKPLGTSAEVCKLNIGGTVFATTRATLNRVPGSFLALISAPDAKVPRDSDGVPFLDRNPRWFELILDALREPNYAPALPLADPLFQRELEFYGLLHVFLPSHLRRPHVSSEDFYQRCARLTGDSQQSQARKQLHDGSARSRPALESGGSGDDDHEDKRRGEEEGAGDDAIPEISSSALAKHPSTTYTASRSSNSNSSSMNGLAKRPSSGAALAKESAAQPEAGLERLVVVGGFDETTPYKFLRTAEAYNPQEDKWERLSDMFWDRSHSGVLTHGNDLYVLGGRNEKPDGVVGNFNASRQTWQEAVDMLLPVAVFAAGFAVVRGKMLLVGGCYESSGEGRADRVSNRVFEYPLDPSPAAAPSASGSSSSSASSRPKWKQSSANLRTARGRHQCAVLRGKVYAIGGVDAYGQVLSSVECYDPSRDVWEEVAPLPQPRRDFGCTVADGGIYVVGGAHLKVGEVTGLVCLDTMYRYNPNNNSWEELPRMRHPRQGLSCSFFGGKIYAMGGSEVDECGRGHSANRLKLVERFDINTHTWEPVADLTARRAYPGSGVVQGAAAGW